MGERPLYELIAAVRLPHHAPALREDPGLLVRASSGGVHAGDRTLSPADAHALSRAIRTSLAGPKSTTVRPGGQRPVVVWRVSEAIVRVHGQLFAREAAVQLAVALDIAAHRVGDERMFAAPARQRGRWLVETGARTPHP